MSGTKKAESLPLASTLTASDTLLAVTPSGLSRVYLNSLDALKCSVARPQSSIQSGWVRIGYFDVEGCVVLSLFGRWGSAIPQQALLCASGHMNGDSTVNRMQNLLSYPAVKSFTKGRIVKTSGNSRLYLDIYFATSFSAINISLVSGTNFSLTAPQLIESMDANQTAFEVSLIGGGKRRYFSVLRYRRNIGKVVGLPLAERVIDEVALSKERRAAA